MVAAGPAPAEAQSNSCEYAFDGECDEAYGTGICTEGTDSWDCRRIGEAPGSESCPYSGDGQCDEPGGTGLCIPYTDTADCLAEGIDPDFIFYGLDDRIWPDSAQMPWSAIGRLIFDNGNQCTGALIGPQSVLTAAHCLYAGDGPGGLGMPLEFIAGAHGADFIDRANVVEQYHPPEFDMAVFEMSPDVDGYDWAVLTLDRPIGETVGWLDVAPLTRDELDDWVADGSTVVQAGYSADSLGFLSAHPGCPIVEIWDDNTFYHECDILFGDAGSPLFTETASGYRVVGVQSATYLNETGGYDYNMAVDARSFWPELSVLVTASHTDTAEPNAAAPDGTAEEPAAPGATFEDLTDKERK